MTWRFLLTALLAAALAAAPVLVPSAMAANLSITAANVSPGTNAIKKTALALEAITAGQVVYRSAAGKFGLADNDSATAAIREPYGIAVGNAATNQSVTVVTQGRVNIGAVVVVGTAYFTSSTPGAISGATSDATSGKYPSLVGFAISTTTIDVKLVFPGVAVP